jgi:hypothetical protein
MADAPQKPRDAAGPAAADSGLRAPDSRLSASAYRPPAWLRNRHLQSILAGSPMRRMRGARGLARIGAVSSGHMIDGGDGVRLHGLHTTLPGMRPRGLALLLHGGEGSTESS